jgi:hypothetical protein
MDYSSAPHLEHYEPSPEEVEAYRQRARDFRELMELELDEINEELEDEEGNDEIVEGDANGVALHVPVAQVEEIFPEANAVALPFDVDFGARILEAGQERQRNGSNSQMKYLVVFPCINSHCSDISMHPLSSLRCTPISLPSCHAPHRADLYEKMSSKESSVCSHRTALVRREIKNK